MVVVRLWTLGFVGIVLVEPYSVSSDPNDDTCAQRPVRPECLKVGCSQGSAELGFHLTHALEETMNTHGKTAIASIFAIVLGTAAASAQQAPSPPPTTPYGTPIGLEAAKKVMAAAEAEAAKNSWNMAIAILDSTGHLVMLHKLDNTQYGSILVAEDKARTALDFRRPSKVFEDLVAQGGLGMRTLGLRGATPLEGGLPIIVDGKIIGAIGASGATAVQDGQVAKAGADAAK
jgi:glc operon protein GlcG